MMTDEQIIKALECCTIDGEKDCFNCAETNWMSCRTALMKRAIDLINRQKEEIEQLRRRDEDFLLKNYTFDKYYNEHIKKAKSEAIKEFAEKVSSRISIEEYNLCGITDFRKQQIVLQVLKEMTEGE